MRAKSEDKAAHQIHKNYLEQKSNEADSHTTKRGSKRLENECKSMNDSDDLAHTLF